MKSSTLCRISGAIAVSLLSLSVYPQTFSERTEFIFPGVSNGSVSWGDYDNDGDPDLLIAGVKSDSYTLLKIFRNNAGLSFTDLGGLVFSPAIPDAYAGYTVNYRAAWADFNNDNYLDFITAGPAADGSSELVIYRNNANSTFTKVFTSGYLTFEGGSSFDCGDYDNDGDLDIVLSGSAETRILRNKGTFSFTAEPSLSFPGLTYSSSKWIDYDSDNDLDLLISGQMNRIGKIFLYQNQGYDTFVQQNPPFFGTGSLDFGDYNNDGFPDILVTGNSAIYRNNGNNTFSRLGSGLPYMTNSTGKWGDLDNDGDNDIIMTGGSATKVFLNVGTGFQELTGTGLAPLSESFAGPVDYDSDGDLDLVIMGVQGLSKICKLYRNESAVTNLPPAAPSGLASAISGNDIVLSWNQVTGDNTASAAISYNLSVGTSPGASDIVNANSSPSGYYKSAVMGNSQLGTSFVLRNLQKRTYYWKVQAVDNSFKGSPFSSESSFAYNASVQAYGLKVTEPGGIKSTLGWTRGNWNNCLVFMKEGNSGSVSPSNGVAYAASSVFKSGSQISGWYCVYKGTGNSVQVTGLKANTSYVFQVFESDAATSYDPQTAANNPLAFNTKIFTDANISLQPITRYEFNSSSSSNYWFDSDNDNDLDLLLLGITSAYLYRNDGGNVFTSLPLSITGGYSASMADYDNDGFIDILLEAGMNGIYRNNHDNTFIKQPVVLPDLYTGPVAWNDYNNDGNTDFIMAGGTGSEGNKTHIFRNKGDGTFERQDLIMTDNLGYGSVKWGDYDNDGFNDFILSGSNNSAQSMTSLYRNNGKGNFVKQATPFSGAGTSTIDWGDYDLDGDLDLVVGDFYSTKVYRNDGNSVFTEQNGIVLNPSGYGSVSWGDYDNDGDPDILLAGFVPLYKPSTKIYRNNGDGTFTEELNAGLPGVGFGYATWGDYDNDGDLDIVMAGTDVDKVFSKIFRNDYPVTNVKPAAPSSPAANVVKSDVTLKWKSVRSDNTPYRSMTYNIKVGTSTGGINVISPGSDPATGHRRIPSPGNAGPDTVFYVKNMKFGSYFWSVQAVDNGLSGGSFSSEGTFQVVPVQASDLTARIIDKNSLLLKWERGNGERVAVFSKQTSSGNAVPLNNTTYVADSEFGYGGKIGSTGWVCVFNGRSDSVTVTGLTFEKEYSFHVIEYSGSFGSENYFTGTGNGNPGVFTTSLFAKQTGIVLPPGSDTPPAWGDYDNDGFIDILLPGNPTKIFRNNKDNTFSEVPGLTFPVLYHGSAMWGDYDNDNDLDFVISGSTIDNPASGPVTKLYRNDGSNVFTEQPAGFQPVYYSSTEWHDYNGDGFLDLLLTGATGTDPSFNPVSKIYLNNRNGTFTVQSIPLTGIYKGTARWGDYDNDGDADIALAGVLNYDENNNVILIYKNNGNNTFTEQSTAGLTGGPRTSIAWGDFDNDADLDLLVSTYFLMLIYENKGNNQFTTIHQESFGYQDAAGSAWCDYDNDGFPDIVLARPGLDTEIFRNIKGLNGKWFKRQDDEALSSTGYRFVSMADYDNDGDPDIALTKGGLPSIVFRNNLIMKSGQFKSNAAPSALAGMKEVYSPSGVTLKWNPATDDITPHHALTYNLMLGSTAGSENMASSNSAATGFRKIATMGNSQTDTTYVLRGLAKGTYHWKVQAVDQGFKAGAWSAGRSFEIKTVQTFFSTDEVCLGFSTSFTDQSVATAGISSWKWDFRDGTVSTSQNPSHTYAANGTYNVKLVITDAGGTKDSLEQAVIVRPKPLSGFDVSSVCQGVPVTATNTTDLNGLAVTSWKWDFGDGSTSALQQPAPHPYLNADDYTIKLRATASNGCADSVSKVVSVGSYPVAAITSSGPLTFCKGDSVTLSVPLNSAYTYSWKISGTSLAGASENIYKPKNSGTYTVEIVNPKGNCISTSPVVNVVALDAPSAPIIVADGQLAFCQGDSAVLSVTNASGNSYSWKLNGGALGLNKNSFSAKAAGEYSLVVSNSSGCVAGSVNKITVAVNPKPALPVISTSGVTTFCQGSSVDLSVPAGIGNLYAWRNENGVLAGMTTNSYTASASGSYLVAISNSYSCAVTTSAVKVTVKPSPLKPSLNPTNFVKGKCPGEEPVRLSADQTVTGYRYTWYKNGLPQQNDTLPGIEFFESGNYKLAASLGDCTAESEIFTAEFPEGLPKPIIYAQGPTFWYLASSNTEAAKYRWYYNGKAVEGADKYYYLANYSLGNYQVSIGNKDGCYTRSDIITIPSGYTGTEDAEPFEGIKIFPNPTSGLFAVEMDNNIFGELSIDIFSQSGSKVLNIKFEKTTEHFKSQVDLSGQAKGMYVMNFGLNKFFATKKILVE